MFYMLYSDDATLMISEVVGGQRVDTVYILLVNLASIIQKHVCARVESVLQTELYVTKQLVPH